MAKNKWENDSGFFKLYTVNTDRAILFRYLLANFFKESYINSVKSYKYEQVN